MRVYIYIYTVYHKHKLLDPLLYPTKKCPFSRDSPYFACIFIDLTDLNIMYDIHIHFYTNVNVHDFTYDPGSESWCLILESVGSGQTFFLALMSLTSTQRWRAPCHVACLCWRHGWGDSDMWMWLKDLPNSWMQCEARDFLMNGELESPISSNITR